MVQIKTDSFYIDIDWFCFTFDIAYKILIEITLCYRSKHNFNWGCRIGSYNSTHGSYKETFELSCFTTNRFLTKVERYRNMIFIDQINLLYTFGVHQKRVERQSWYIKHDFRFYNFSKDKEFARYSHRFDLEHPARYVDTH